MSDLVIRAFAAGDTADVIALWEAAGLTRPWNDPARDIERKMAVDPELFLVGTVAYIVAVGLYKLFISSTRIELPTRLKINSLKDLEDKIIGVVVAALAVAFLGQAAGSGEPAALLNYGGGIALVIAALAFFMRQNSKDAGPDSEK